MILKKNLEKKIEKSWFFQLKNQFFQVNILLEKSIFQLKKSKFLDLFWDFFSKSFFSMMKKYFSMGFFLKSISWSRRIVLKRFRSDSDSLKVRKPVPIAHFPKKPTQYKDLHPLKKIILTESHLPERSVPWDLIHSDFLQLIAGKFLCQV